MGCKPSPMFTTQCAQQFAWWGLLSKVAYKVQCAYHIITPSNDLRVVEVARTSTGQRLREREPEVTFVSFALFTGHFTRHFTICCDRCVRNTIRTIDDRGNAVIRDMKTIVNAKDSTQLVKNLPSMHKALRLIPHPS